MLAGRVRKTFKRLRPVFGGKDTDAFRIYDRDIPEIRALVDWYAGHVVVAEFERWQTQPAGDWLGVMGSAVGQALQVPTSRVHLKRRRTRPQQGPRYPPGPAPGAGPGLVLVREQGLHFRVNLEAYLDTGLFLDHRVTRSLIRAQSGGASVLNLFAYAGGFSVAALSGGAKHVTSVDLSKTYLAWAQTNLRENHLPLERHEPARKEVFTFLRGAAQSGRRWDLVIADPPSFSTVGADASGFDIIRDHPALIESALRVLAPGGTLFFCTHHQRFQPRFEGLGPQVEEISERTIPPDFRNRGVHRVWQVRGPPPGS